MTTEEKLTIGLINAMRDWAKELCKRDLSAPAVQAALRRLADDEHMIALLDLDTYVPTR